VSVEELAELLGYRRQTYYKRIKIEESRDMRESLVLSLVKEKRKLWKKGSGRNLHASLKEEFKKHGIKIGRDKFFDILRSNKLLVKKKLRRTRTTYSYHHFHKYPNLIKDLDVARVNQVIVSDITYLYLRDSDSFAYLFLVTDLFSRKVLGFKVSDNLSAKSAVEALRMALNNMSDIEDVIHHSDRGIQYCSHEYTALLKNYGIRISMTENSDPLENAVAERINKTLKEEFTTEKQISFGTLRESKIMVSQIIKFYNDERPHRSLEMFTPSYAYKLNKVLKRKWKTYYTNYSQKDEDKILSFIE
jgi:transposase InsO family protein